MTVEANPSSGRARSSALAHAGAALAVALMASPAFAGCGSSGVSSGIHPPSTGAGVHTGATTPSGSTSSGSSCATGISNTTKLGANTVHVSGGSGGGSTGSTHHGTHQSFTFQGKPKLTTGSHKHNP